MKVNLALILMVVAGLFLIISPESLLGIPKTAEAGAFRVWSSCLKLFGIPLTLILLSFTKNVLVQVGAVLWGGLSFFSTVLFLLKANEYAPQLTQYGKTYVACVLIISLALFIFSLIQFLPKSLKIRQSENPPLNPS